MLLSAGQAKHRLDDPDNLVTRFGSHAGVEHREIRRRRSGTPLPEGLKAQIGADVLLGAGTQEQIAEEYGVSPSTVAEAKRDLVNNPQASAMAEQVNATAFDRLMSTLGFITDDKLSGCSAKDLSSVAANMARVVQQTSPKSQDEQVKVIIYAPEQKKTSQYKIVDV